MKKLVLPFLFCIWFVPVYAQKLNTDSLAYQLQRKKINSMLDERRQKFGQYDESLAKHSGIFGLQTKKDIRRSNDILMDIAKTDENIFKQIKILLNYRTYELNYSTFQQQQVKSKSTELETNSLGYMNTINRLREQVDKLKNDAITANQQLEKTQRNHVIIFVLMLGSILYLLLRKRAVKT
jgi:hypothetical protein